MAFPFIHSAVAAVEQLAQQSDIALSSSSAQGVAERSRLHRLWCRHYFSTTTTMLQDTRRHSPGMNDRIKATPV